MFSIINKGNYRSINQITKWYVLCNILNTKNYKNNTKKSTIENVIFYNTK